MTQHGRESLEALSPEALASLAPLPYGQPSDAYRSQWIQIISEVMEEEGMKCGVPVEEIEAEDGGGQGARARRRARQHGEPAPQPGAVGRHHGLLDLPVPGASSRDALVLHMVGGFHVERGTGTPEHLEAYRPGTSRMIVVLQPVEDVDTLRAGPGGRVGRLRDPDRSVAHARRDRVPGVPGRARGGGVVVRE